MDFLKLFSDMEQLFEPFTDEERGALLTAMMAYAFHGEDTEFDGNERFVWPVLRRHIDQCRSYNTDMAELGRKGGKASAASRTKQPVEAPLQSASSESNRRFKREQENSTAASSRFKLQEQEQEQEHIQEQEQEHEQEHEHEHVVTARAREARRFRPPTVEEVSEYCQERGMKVDPQRFVDHYTANGWKVGGRSSMRDWRAALRNWERNEFSGNASGARDSPKDSGVGYGQILRQREYTPTQFGAMEMDLDAADEHGRLPGEPGYGT